MSRQRVFSRTTKTRVREFCDIDVDWEDGETVAVRLVRTAAAEAPAPGPGVSVADARVREAAGAVLRFTVTLAAAPSETVSVRYATSDGTATAGADYAAASGAVRFTPGSRTVSVRVLGQDAQDRVDDRRLADARSAGDDGDLRGERRAYRRFCLCSRVSPYRLPCAWAWER